MNNAKLLFSAILSGNHGAASHWVLSGADPNFILPEGAAPIHVAAGLDSVPEEIIRLLLRHGADPNLRSSEGETPLHVSAAYGRCEVLKLFLLSGADPDILNQDGQSAADLARQSGCEMCILTLQDFYEAEAEILEDDRTAFSLEPYEPCLFPPLQPFPHMTDESPEITLYDLDNTQTYTLDSRDVICDSKETTASTLNSSSSFHTCPSDNDIAEQRRPKTECQTTTNQTLQKNKGCSREPKTELKPPSDLLHGFHVTCEGSNGKETSNSELSQFSEQSRCDASKKSECCSQPSSRSPSHNASSSKPLSRSKSETRVIKRSDSSILDYSPGRSLNAGVVSKKFSATAVNKANSNPNSPCGSKSAIDKNPHSKSHITSSYKPLSRSKSETRVIKRSDSSILDYSPGSSLNSGVRSKGFSVTAANKANSKPNSPCGSKSAIDKNLPSKGKWTFKEKRDELFDDTISSCSSAAFMPTEFNYSDLSLHIDPLVVRRNTSPGSEPQGQSPQKTSLPPDKDKDDKYDESIKDIRSRTGCDLWYGQMHHYDKALSTTTEFSFDAENLPRTSSRNEVGVCADWLDNLSLSTIAENICDGEDAKKTLSERINAHDVGSISTHLQKHTEKSPRSATKNRPQSVGNKESVPVDGPSEQLLSNTGDRNKENVALHGPCQRFLLNSGDRSNCSQARHWSLGSSSSKGSRNSSTSSVGPVHFLYTDDEDGYSLIESWYPTQDQDLKIVSPEPHPISPLTLPASPQPVKNCSTLPTNHSTPPKNHSKHPKNCSPQSQNHSTQLNYQESLDLSDSTIIYEHKVTRPTKSKTKCAWGVDTAGSCTRHGDASVSKLTNVGLRKALMAQGVTPGPINEDTRELYEQKLVKLKQNHGQTNLPKGPGYLPEMARLLAGDLDTSLLQNLEDEMVKPFSDLDPKRKWREGTRKFSFNYLLLDPRITDNLPARVKTIGEVDAFRDFVKAIFYVGKGKRARPYAHFKEAIQHKAGAKIKLPGPKVQKILDVWSDGYGVISLHVFQNVIPVEAYTREAAMIDAIGRPKLTNIKGGEYYGVAASWTAQKRRALGTRLLHKSFRIFLSEGERHIRPADIQGS